MQEPEARSTTEPMLKVEITCERLTFPKGLTVSAGAAGGAAGARPTG
jgi:hypothetical protein